VCDKTEADMTFQVQVAFFQYEIRRFLDAKQVTGSKEGINGWLGRQSRSTRDWMTLWFEQFNFQLVAATLRGDALESIRIISNLADDHMRLL
jgi:hypothetical protein